MNAPLPTRRDAADPARAGFAFGLAAYGLWGVLPIYFKRLAGGRRRSTSSPTGSSGRCRSSALLLFVGQRLGRRSAQALRRPPHARILLLSPRC